MVGDRAKVDLKVTAANTAIDETRGDDRIREPGSRSPTATRRWPVKQKLIQYRLAVQGAFPAGHSLIASLPPVTPLPGSTPTAVNLTAVWNAGDLKAHLTWPATTDPRVVSYEVRACFGTRYRTQDESVIGNVALGTEHFETDQGLGSSGAFVNYKVFTQTATGNEKGSNAVKVVRP